MAKKKVTDEMPSWVKWMGAMTDGVTPDPVTGEVYPVGMEIADPKPMAIPAGMRAPPSLREQMDELFRVGRLREAANEPETIDEANDFDIDDYFHHGDDMTPWQTDYDPLLGREISPAEFHEKYKSGELLEELKSRFAKLDREEDVNEIIARLDAAYSENRKPKKTEEVGRPAASSSASPKAPDPEAKS